MVTEGAGLVAASTNVRLAASINDTFIRAGVVCEQSNDPVGVELAGIAKNAAALAAGHIFTEIWRYAALQGAKPESMIGLAGTGDLGQGVPATEIPARIGQARRGTRHAPAARHRAHVDAPVTTALHGLVSGELPLEEWVQRGRPRPPSAGHGVAEAARLSPYPSIARGCLGAVGSVLRAAPSAPGRSARGAAHGGEAPRGSVDPGLPPAARA
jgi:glycerol-3-phosphate dehydrogenase (NAD(P)+)